LTIVAFRQLHLRFDPNQEHQRDAVESVVRLFEGLPRQDTAFRLSEDVVPNLAPGESLDEDWLRDNLLAVQREQKISSSLFGDLAVEDGLVLDGAGTESWRYPSFTVEMETGTGKTYVYLRTIHELRRRYGFGKFVIVVPSVAIYEGVVKNFHVTHAHFAALYGNEPVNLVRYDGAQVSRLRGFATSTFCEVLLITLDAFNKAGRRGNNFYKASEKLPGERRPFEYVQETRPILILDEPQNMESLLSREALRTLHPLLALRYSATHRTSPNLVYRLTPFEAYRRNLVKRIQVAGVTEVEDLNTAFIGLTKIESQGKIRARVRTYVLDGGRAKEAEVVLCDGDDLFAKTKRAEHRGGYVVREINRGERWLEFENNLRLSEGDTIGRDRPEVFRTQIRETIEHHLEAQERLRPKGIKVLSLFFVDRVASYTAPDGIARLIFDEEFRKLRRKYPEFRDRKPEDVRRAYFAMSKRGGDVAVDIGGDGEALKANERELAKDAYALIMREKERLLSFDEPVSFIFAHSALKEGWDNPNVFQICTLNQTVSETKKRQEIGRGLRLCVDQRGERVTGDEVNVLTVVANQSYQSYAKALQDEYVADGDASGAPPKPSNAKQRKAVRRDALFVTNPEFRAFWDKLARRIRYRIDVETERLVQECAADLARAQFPAPKVVVQKGDFVVHKYTFTLKGMRGARARLQLEVESTAGETANYTKDIAEQEDLARTFNDQRLRGFRVLEAYGGEPTARVLFENGVELYAAEPQTYESAEGQQVRVQEVRVAETTYPVFNLVDRTAQATGLTRATVNRIFKAMPDEQKRRIFRNPEGFAGVFVATIKEALARHVSSGLTFNVDAGREDIDLEELFPKEKSFAQKELIDAGRPGLYDLVQKDSNVEETFVRRLRDDAAVVLYFKFPPAFKIRLPRLIGNYNPDWGIVRRASDGRVTLHLVRETKGTEKLEDLQFPHERRKIECAEKYFAATGIDYRPITGETSAWWEPWSTIRTQQSLRLGHSSSK
jgi:type III restriction enzyme